MFNISKALGHSSTAVTSAVYMHLFDDAVADVVSLVANAITGEETLTGTETAARAGIE